MKKQITGLRLLFKWKYFRLLFIAINVFLFSHAKVKAQFATNVQDSLELVKFYNATGGPNWKNKTGWLQGPVPTWYGVDATNYPFINYHVYGIRLPNNNLTGQIPDLKMSFGLQTLDLSNNKLIGDIPDLTGGDATGGVQFLNLDSNQLTGIPNFTGKRYEKIEIQHNKLSGNLPAFSLPNLKELNLTSNLLTGLNNLNCPGLELIYLDSNQIAGSLPNFNLPNLRDLSINANQLSGSIPALSLPNLTGLSLVSNKLTGSIPNLNLPNSIYVDFGDNQLSGGIAHINLNSNGGLNLTNNRLTFDSMEYLFTHYFSTYFYPQANINIHKKSNSLSVYAGGTLANNKYLWFQQLPNSSSFTSYKQVQGDSTLIDPPAGSYYVMVTNSVSPLLLLFSDTVSIGMQVRLSNPNPSMIKNDASLDSNLALLDFSIPVVGAVTDGVTKLLIVAESTDSLKFSIGNTKDGGLSTFANQTKFLDNVVVQPRNGKVVAIYTVPDGYGLNNPRGGRDITVKVYNAQDQTFLRDVIIKLKTPPVVLVHGMWSSPSAWVEGGFENRLIAEKFGSPYLVNYEKDNFRTFNPDDPESKVVRDAIMEQINSALIESSFDGYAATQVEVVGHSLGGLMARSLSQQSEFVTKENYKKGYIHKLITLGTPHRGSPFGPVLYNNKDLPVKFIINFGTLGEIFASIGKPVGSVHKDFGNQSSGVNALKQTLPFKTFAITANAKGDGILPGQIWGKTALNLALLVGLHKSLDEVMTPKTPCPQDPLENDLIVPLSSQKGYISKDTIFYNTAHSGPANNTETNSPEVQDKVVRLLLSDDTTAFDRGFPAPSGFPFDCTTASQRTTLQTVSNSERQMNLNGDQAIKISSPLKGTVYSNNSGASITLSIDALGGAIFKDALFMTKELGWFPLPQSAPFSLSFTLPPNAPVGKINLIAMARDTTGLTMVDTSYIIITASGILDSLAVDPGNLKLDSTIRSRSIYVKGYYKNGSTITFSDLTAGSTGTRYSTQKNNTIFKVDSTTGVVTAVSQGTDTLVIKNGIKTLKVPVIVNNNFSAAKLFSNTISFPAITDKTFGDNPIGLSASATSGDDVKFTVVSGPATINNNIISFTGPGTVTVKASQSGNVYYAAATDVTQTFCVKPITPIISAGSSTTFCTGGSVTLTSNVANGNQWYKDGVAISGSSGTTLNVATGGNYTAKSSVNGCESVVSNAIDVIVNSGLATPTITAGTATAFCNGGNVTLTSNAANGNQWYKDGTAITGSINTALNVTTGGNYTVKQNLSNCTSLFSNVIAVTVNPIPPIPTITQIGNQLTSSAVSGNQWFLNSTPINGATGQQYNVQAAGLYTAQVTLNSCSATSAVFNFVATGIVDPSIWNYDVVVFPNPANESLFIINHSNRKLDIQLMDISGKIALQYSLSTTNGSMNIGKLAKGVYLVGITDKQKRETIHQLIIKQ